MEESKPKPGSPVSKRNAIKYRDGLMIALPGCIPIRRKIWLSLKSAANLSGKVIVGLS